MTANKIADTILLCDTDEELSDEEEIILVLLETKKWYHQQT